VPGASRGSLNKLDAIRSSLEAKLRTSLQSNKEIELEQGLAQSEAARRKDQSSSLEPSLQSKKKSEKHNDSANDVEIPEAERRRLDERAGVVPWEAAANKHNIVPDYVAELPSNRSISTAPVVFPYNLLAPAPPSTPRTTRQQMLRNEMSESLPHNLLWQRKLSRTDTIGPRLHRTKSTVNVPSEATSEADPGGKHETFI
jgi:hypothetical protein